MPTASLTFPSEDVADALQKIVGLILAVHVEEPFRNDSATVSARITHSQSALLNEREHNDNPFNNQTSPCLSKIISERIKSDSALIRDYLHVAIDRLSRERTSEGVFLPNPQGRVWTPMIRQ